MKKIIILGLSGLFFLPSITSASETYFFYEHSYATENRIHSDNFGLLHEQGDAWYKIKIDFYGKNKDTAFDEVVSNSYSFFSGYHFHLNNLLTLSPSMQARFYSGGTSGQGTPGEMGDSQTAGARYTPGLMLSWQAADPLSLYTQYRYDYRKLARGRAAKGEQLNRHRHRYEVGTEYHLLENLALRYKAFWHKADYVLADNKKHDYQQDIYIDWQVNPAWQLNIGAQDVAKSAQEGGREALLKTGVTYTF